MSYNGQTISYDEIGNPLTYRDGNEVTGANHIGRVNRILYRGYYYDEESGSQYFKCYGMPIQLLDVISGVIEWSGQLRRKGE